MQQNYYCKIKAIFILFLFLIVGAKSFATHIVGGFTSYRYISGNTYELTLKVFRDCNSNVTTLLDGDPNNTNVTYASIGLFEVNGTSFSLVNELQLTNPVITNITTNNNPCLTVPAGVCVEQGVYTTTFTVPDPTKSYVLAYERCCRNASISNLVAPVGDWGAAYVANIPPTNIFHNSSPTFNNFPPPFICKDAPLNFNHSASDIDGDSLVYSLCTPFNGGDRTNPAPQPPNNPPYGNVAFAPPFSTTDPLGGVPLAIDPTTGLLTGTPNALGQYVVGICVSEYRNGVLIGTYLRDFQFNVSNCNVPIPNIPYLAGSYDPATGYGVYKSSCNSTIITFNSGITAYNPPPTSIPLTYHWDFGVTTATDDTANILNPNFFYPDTGTYIATLIATKQVNGIGCSDTARALVLVYPTLTCDFSFVNVCNDSAVHFTDLSVSTASPITAWKWTFGDGSTSTQQNPIKKYTNAGTYTVKLEVTNKVGCVETKTYTVTTYPVPVPNFTINPICIYDSIQITSTTTGTITNYQWSFGNGQTSTLPTNTVSYNSAGVKPIELIVVSDKGCRDTVLKQLTVNPLPTISLTSDTIICPNTSVQLYSSGGTSYSWTPKSLLNDSTLANPIATMGSTPTTFIVNVKDANGCKNKDSVLVSLFPQPVIDAGVDTSVCYNPGSYRDSVQLLASGTPFFSWSPILGLSNPNIANPICRPTQNTTYIVTGTDLNGCKAVDSMTVFLLDPNLDLIADTVKAICQYDTTTLNVAIQGASYYAWTPNIGINNANINSPLFYPTTTQTYYFEVRNYCYSKKDTATILVHPLPTVGSQKIDSMCYGDTIQLHATGAKDYFWSYNLTLSDTNIAEPYSFTLKDTTYYVLGIDSFGCKNRDSIRIFVFQYPITTVLPLVPFVCQNDSVQLVASGGVSYHWLPNPYLSSTTIANPIAVMQDTSTFYVDVTNVHNCTTRDSLTINVQLPVVAVAQEQYDVCIGNTVQLSASGGFYYLWKPASYLTSPYIYNPVAFPPRDTSYTVYVSNDCFTDSVDVAIIFHPLPTVNAGNDTSIYRNTNAILNGTTNASKYYWYPDEFVEHPLELTTNAAPLFTKDYLLFAVSDYGCVNVDTVRINVTAYTLLLLPTGFSPNNDGANDVFRVANYLNIQKLEAFSIYNRWGELVFTTTDINKGWDGTFKGKPQELGVYSWVIRATTYDNESIVRGGNVTLLR